MTTIQIDTQKAAKGRQLAEVIGLDLTDTQMVLHWVTGLPATDEVPQVLAMAWSEAHVEDGLWMSPRGGVIPVEYGATYRKLSQAEVDELQAYWDEQSEGGEGEE